MPIYEPVAVKQQGNVKVTFVTSIASPAAPSLASEITAASSVEGTMAVYGQWAPAVNVNTGNSPARIGTTVQLPEEGNAQRQPIALAYSHDPSKDDTDPNNKLKALLVEGTVLYAVVRRGLDAETDFAVADRVEVWQVRCGYQNDDGATGTDEFSEFQVTQNLIPLTTEPTIGAVAA
ncbi:MAG TPA: hypothetical protein VFH56_10925 [Acidimicrobiales bacterium]|nr:hypothetical protein [Acidimicrobiales bacterium]